MGPKYKHSWKSLTRTLTGVWIQTSNIFLPHDNRVHNSSNVRPYDDIFLSTEASHHQWYDPIHTEVFTHHFQSLKRVGPCGRNNKYEEQIILYWQPDKLVRVGWLLQELLDQALSVGLQRLPDCKEDDRDCLTGSSANLTTQVLHSFQQDISRGLTLSLQNLK